MSEPIQCACLGCDREEDYFPEGNGWISLDGYSFTLCRTCWDGMRPFERVLLSILSRTGFDSEDGGGLGVSYELSNILHTLEKLFRAWHGHSVDHACHQCDPAEAANRERLRQEARRKKEARP